MPRHHERFAWDDEDHGLGDIARRNAQADYRDKFDTEQRTQNMPGDFGTRYASEPFARGHRDDYGPYSERYSETESRFTGRGRNSSDHRNDRPHGYRGRGPKNYARSDERILEDICERLWDADDVDASDVTVEVKDGEVSLRGNVERRRIKHRIEDIADACGGVKDIHNEIRVQPRNEWPYDKGVAPGATAPKGQGEGMIQSTIENMPPRQ